MASYQVDSTLQREYETDSGQLPQRTKDEHNNLRQCKPGFNNSVSRHVFNDDFSEDKVKLDDRHIPDDRDIGCTVIQGEPDIQDYRILKMSNYITIPSIMTLFLIRRGIENVLIKFITRLKSQATAFKTSDSYHAPSVSPDFVIASLTSNYEREAFRKQQRGRAPQVFGSGWKPCRQLKHYKQASHTLRSMGTATEPQVLCFIERQFDVSQLPAGIPAEMTDMKLESNRLKSFSLDGRPAFIAQCTTGQLPEALAANGFFYMQDTDRVKCAFCLGVLFNWKQGEGVQEAHRLRFSTCPFLLGLDVGNKPMQAAEEELDDKLVKVSVACSEDSEPEAANDVFPGWCHEGLRHPHPEVECCSDLMRRTRPPVSATVATAACRPSATDNLELFSRSLHSPDTAARYHPMRHTFWRDPARREDSLARSSQAVPADMLACAGFFLDAERQHTTCYWCGLQVLTWLGADDPWIEHSRWSPRCCHLLLERGHEFVLAARAACPPYQLQKLLRQQPGGSSGQLQTDSAAGASCSAESSSMLSFVSGSNLNIDFRIEPRCFKAREDFPPTLATLRVGCDPDDVKTAQFLQLKGTGDDFPTYELFLHGVLSQNRRRQQLGGTSGREFYEQVQREQAQACSREPRTLGEDDVDWRACKVCMDKVINTTLLDCKHLCCCSDCAKRLDACPLCRSPIRATMLVNMD